MSERSAENDVLRELVKSGMTYAEAEANLTETDVTECDHLSRVWLDLEPGWRCYDCGFVIGHPERADYDALRAAVLALTWDPPVRDAVSGKTSPPRRKVHVRVRDIDAILRSTEGK